ncbi:MAG: hypothetical protein M1840_002702 [Geoglossum simile]|nr:MAG: hypothetical protein M1840_002702 [Geoglossum simile]
MTDTAHTAAADWAVLIGVNFYGNQVRGLKGAVADVQAMEQYLRAHGIQQIQVLTSDVSPDPGSKLPKEAPSQWPTPENVTASLERIIDMSQRGDFVYIHFSGHGMQMKATSPEYSHEETGDLALVLFHQDYGARCMQGIKLAELLQRMVAHGLFITVVLDCCFSGSVIRRDDTGLSSIRAIPYDSAIDSAFPFDGKLEPSRYRVVQSVPTWLIDPNGYNIFAACSPHETAQEMRLGPDSSERRGALSYFLYRALQASCGAKITTRSLYNHLRLKFHLFWPRQTPMQFGRAEQSFFRALGREQNTDISVLRKGQDLYLDAGLAHGVCKDDEYAIYPLLSAEMDPPLVGSPSFYARVHTVEGLTSTLIKTASQYENSCSETRWQAKRISLSTWKVPVHLNCDDNLRAQWMEIASHKRFLHLLSENYEDLPSIFYVSLNGEGKYEILDSSRHPLKLLPAVSRNGTESITQVSNMLEHLSAFKYVAGIENLTPCVSFEESFIIQILDETGNRYLPGEVVPVQPDELFTLDIQNCSETPLFFEIFDMDSLWQITQVLAGGGEEFKVVTPKKQQDDRPEHTGRQKVPFRASIPDELKAINEHECEDIFKVFITSKATSFATLQMPPLVVSADISRGATRGRNNYHDLAAFLGDFAAPFRASDMAGAIENWTTRTFVIKTS